MKKVKVSVIVPVYNSEKYLDKCVSSLINQTYDNLEIIFINDGSRDNSLKVLKKYEKMDDRIIVINKKNSGVSDSRNIGINHSSGEYIMFVDSDDWLEKNAVEIAIHNICDNDILRFSHYLCDEVQRKIKNNNDDIYSGVDVVVANNEDIIKNLIENKTEGHLWNYLFRSSIIRDNCIYFDKTLFYQEDVLFLVEYFLRVKSMRVISDSLYNYFENTNSTTHNVTSSVKNLCSIWNIRKKILVILENNNMVKFKKNLEQRFLNLQLEYFIKFYKEMSIGDFNSNFRRIANSNRLYYRQLLDEKYLNKKWQIFITLLLNQKPFLFRIYIKSYMIITKK